jgi:phenylalanyl-tRNA synthetase alpha subunit
LNKDGTTDYFVPSVILFLFKRRKAMDAINKIKELKEKIIADIHQAKDEQSLRVVQEGQLSKKGPLNSMMSMIKELSGEAKAAFGQAINNAKKEIMEVFSKKEKEIQDAKIKEKLEKLNKKYETKKERLWKQFNAMETALSKANSQSDYFANYM